MRNYFLLGALLCLSACGSSGGGGSSTVDPEIPTEPTTNKDTLTAKKPRTLWIDADANFGRFATKENVTNYLDKIKDTGFTEIYLDVKPGEGYALYNSDILPQMTKLNGETVTRSWDYLGYWLEEANKRGIEVIATISAMGYGNPQTQEGLVYDTNKWDGKTQVRMDSNNPNKLIDIRNDKTVVAAALNPTIPEVQSFVISIVAEIATKYPKLKGICLDYCRWMSLDYGFSDATLAGYKAYWNEEVTNRNNIITSTGGVGTQFSKWIEYRSMTITNLISSIRTKLKTINPKMDLQLWASADWGARYTVGQNWGSKKYVPASDYMYTSTYSKTGFADQLDVFVLGAYTEYVWKSEYPNSVWTVENFVTTYNNFVKSDCPVYGSITTYAYKTDAALSDAIYLCLKNTDGIMIFELSHMADDSFLSNYWTSVKTAFARATK